MICSAPWARWRAMLPEDLCDVFAIACRVHTAFFEDMPVFAERQRLFPEGAKYLEIDGRGMGYLLSHPWSAGEPPLLNSLLGGIPAAASTYYIHDLALLPDARGTGATAAVIAMLEELAISLSFRTISLVAVNGSQRFWARHGFMPVRCPEFAEKLASYEDSAALMVRELDA